ncbi:hypothetical protein NFX46_21660 [Streptomyces phaeoluteigriseus]|uniref:Uncharacterized protein n=1 Tax=Streptomyces phaeoluteigriseus TaxID=114686 RepID=A0ABY4ZB82_9ACTN|nr:hypothetical protein [Streptomyces phaeoluteigriseus]USQ86089.1 hypothetical protein NFX46_21660 [Streptomyces phaeoluteigriseus]
MTVQRGQDYTLRGSTTPAVHRQLLAHCRAHRRPLGGAQGVPAHRQARREYENRVSALATAGA